MSHASPSQGYQLAKLSMVPIYTLGWRYTVGTVKVKTKSVLPKNTTQCPWPGLEPGPLAVESSTLNMRTPSLPLNKTVLHMLFNNK